jgi:hypothetical protein
MVGLLFRYSPDLCGVLATMSGGVFGAIGIVILLLGIAQIWYNGITILRKPK